MNCPNRQAATCGVRREAVAQPNDLLHSPHKTVGSNQQYNKTSMQVELRMTKVLRKIEFGTARVRESEHQRIGTVECARSTACLSSMMMCENLQPGRLGGDKGVTMNFDTEQNSVDRADSTQDRIRSLVANLESDDPTVRTKTREALGVMGKPAVPSVIQLLSHPKPRVRWEAAKTLCDIADPLAASAMTNAMDDRDSDVRWLAAEGLAALGRDGLRPLLAALIERAQSSWFCEGAYHVCYDLAKREDFSSLLRPLLTVLKEAEPAVAVPPAAYAALSRLRELSAGND